MIYCFNCKSPSIDETCFVADSSDIIGDVTVKENSSIWFGTVIRGDYCKISIGSNTNIQDNSTIHGDEDFSVEIGNGVTIGHNSIIHGCTIKDNCLIGMGSTILNGAEIGENCIIGAGSLITQHTKIPSGTLCFGSPAKVIRKLTEGEINSIKQNSEHYAKISKLYMERR